MRHIILNIVICIVLLPQAYSQKSKVEKADSQFQDYAFIDAIGTYEKVVLEGYRSPELFQRLADSYYFTGDYVQAAKYYSEFLKENPNPKSEYFYRYSLCLKSLKDFVKADNMMDVFISQNSNDQRGRLYADNADYLALIDENSNRYDINSININSDHSDYSPAFYGAGIVFTSNRPIPGKRKPKIDKWSNEPFSNLYVSQADTDGNFSSPKLLSEKLNTEFHQSSAVFSKDGKTIYFTANTYPERKGNTRGIRTLAIMKATVNDEGECTNVKELLLNQKGSNNAHPALSPDEKSIYFSSDRPGSIGESDLYRATINTDGTYGKPENLGSLINTEGRETFPYISDTNELYFSSNGYPGLGGLDIYRAIINPDGTLSQPVNIGKPINGPEDDFGFIIDSTTKGGYYTSNRKEKYGSDNIYKIKELKNLPDDAGQQKLITGTLKEATTNLPIEGATITLYDNQYNKILETTSLDGGRYVLGKLGYGTYRLKAAMPGFETMEFFITVSTSEPENLNLQQSLVKNYTNITIGTNLKEILNTHDLYFEFDRWNLNTYAQADLAKILMFLVKYPNIKIGINAYTDSRGLEDYNLQLSRRRANEAAKWLRKHGISKKRLFPVGCGETNITNQCKDGIECSEKEHRQNRRIDFIVLK